jgi:hypothetical protein
MAAMWPEVRHIFAFVFGTASGHIAAIFVYVLEKTNPRIQMDTRFLMCYVRLI